MSIRHVPAIITLFVLTLNSATASEITGKDLSEDCQELISIYNKKGERPLLAGISTSVAESMRAGICRGMIDEHASHFACRNDWHTMASIIATTESKYRAEQLLEKACGNR